ncbi:MAG TPA: riboflavin synthase, partial [Castellaniella sp.]|nr:riboflavin synthase [Castellaniella sp.]
MFTGIIAAVGRITQVRALGDSPDAGIRAHIDAGGLPLEG